MSRVNVMASLFAYPCDALLLYLLWPVIVSAFPMLPPDISFMQWLGICLFRNTLSPSYLSEIRGGVKDALERQVENV